MIKKIINNIIGSFILAFGIYNIHSISGVTEGGILGLTLLIEHWFSISPAISSIIIDFFCYSLGVIVIGKSFLLLSIISSVSFSIFYSIFELFPRIYPNIYEYPLICSIVGALFVGIGIGLCVRSNGAPGGDDALAMSLSKLFKKDIRIFYFLSDISVLLISLTYIPIARIFYSLITVMLSSQIIGIITKFKK